MVSGVDRRWLGRHFFVAQPLHPNLARLAAAYDEIFERYASSRIDAVQARMEISALVARDDEGILWSIDPDSGEWLRRTITGELVVSKPPTYGLATPTPHDVSSNDEAFNPDTRIGFARVDDELLYAPNLLAGATRRSLDVPSLAPRQWWRNPFVWLAAGLVVVLVLFSFGGDDRQAPAPNVSTSTSSQT